MLPLHHVTYSDTKFEVSTSDGLGGDALKKYIIWLLTLTFESRLHEMLPVVSAWGYLISYKVWSCYV